MTYDYLHIEMKRTTLFLIITAIGVSLNSCDLLPKDDRSNGEKAEMERRRLKEMQRRRAEIEQDANRYQPAQEFIDSPTAHLEFEEYYHNKLWAQSEFNDIDGYYEYGEPDGSIEGVVMINCIGDVDEYPAIPKGRIDYGIEFAFHEYFMRHPGEDLEYNKDLRGRMFDFKFYKHLKEIRSATDVDTEAIYSVVVDEKVYMIVVEKGMQSTKRFMRDYERFVLSLSSK